MTGQLYSWGRYPNTPQTGHSAAWRNEVAELSRQLSATHGSTLPYGNGRSYGDSCFAVSDHVLNMRTLNRYIEVDWQAGTVCAEPGVTLSEILAIAIPRGWFLSVTPGTQFATLGGAIANDVHGKNHHVRGTFGRQVLSFGLLREGETQVCSPSSNAALYNATIGGLGLTGVITWACIQLMPIRASQINSVVERFGNLSEFFALSRELDQRHEYSVAWIDCLAKGANTGRGVFIVGDHADFGSLDTACGSGLSVPFAPPVSLINKVSLKVFNQAYWHIHPSKRTIARTEYEPFFYPLDRILHWNRIYGRRGFQQYQCVIPEATADSAMREVLQTIAQQGQGSFLAVLKRCGDIKSPGLISFPMQGTSLALDFSQRDGLERLFARLDRIVHEAGGRLYPAKDAHMNGRDFRHAYPAWEQLEALRDPSLNSQFWKRVTE